ncbi:MAG: FAD:protein FMN transferase [Ginsengibacter sp.]
MVNSASRFEILFTILFNASMFLSSWLWVLSFCLSPCLQQDLKAVHISGQAQGTTYQLTYYATDEPVGKIQVDSILDKIDSSLSLYKPYSLISRFNRSVSGLPVDEHFVKVIRKSIEVFKNTGGLFDITVQPLVQAWGFGPQPATSLPDSATIQSLLPCVGTNKIHLHGNMLTRDKPCVKIDVNGIAQGYSVDVLAEFLENKGINNYIIELGGEIRVKGHKTGGDKMTIGIESPDDDGVGGHPIKTIIHLDHGAITTSGNYEKYYMSGSKRITHLVDPATGYTLQNEMISATVYAEDAITADGYDNALMAMGVAKALLFVRKQKNMEAYLIYHTPNGAVSDTATAGFYKLMK